MSERARDLLAALLRHRLDRGERSLLLDTIEAGDVFEALDRGAPPTTQGETAARLRAARTGDARPDVARSQTDVSTEAIEAAHSLPVLAELAAGCPRCPLAEGRTRVVFGEGAPTARVMVVGEAPGAQEDRTGRPFVGRAGKLLDRILLSAGFERREVYICNVLKCRPPGNRNPRPEEIEACSPYLLRQLEVVAPSVILACGTFAAQTLLGTAESIGRLRGRTHRYHGVTLVPTYHPAAVLRNPAWGRLVWEDLQLVRGVVESGRSD